MKQTLQRAVACAALAFTLAIPSMTVAAPYSGAPIQVPATFEAENFDRGGEGVGYHDLTRGNSGKSYRKSENVDISPGPASEGGGYIVQNFQTGEWLAYTIKVPSSGAYAFGVRASNNYATPTAFHIEVDGTPASGSIPVPKTGSWDAYQWVSTPAVTLAAGTHVVRVVADKEYFRLNKVRVQAASVAPVPGYSGTPYTGTPIALPRVFEAEDYDRGGQNVAYFDKTAGNSGTYYRTDSVDIMPSTDPAGGGYVVNDIHTGEWLAYTVNVPTAGTYDISVRAANQGYPSAAFHVEIDGVDVTGRIAVPETGGWSAFKWFGKAGVQLAAGTHVLKMVADEQHFDVNQISVLAAGTAGPAPDPTPTTLPEPLAIKGKGYRLVKDWDFVSAIRTQDAMRAEFFTRYVWNNGAVDTLNDEWQRYRDNNNHVFEAEGLALVARLPSGATLANGSIESGMLRSKWTGQYGYFEVNMKVPPGLGMWPAFWLASQDGVWPPEIDVMEIVNNGRDTTAHSWHFVHGLGDGDPALYSLLDQWGRYTPGFDYKDGYHRYAVEWTADRVRHYIDDKLVVERAWRWRHDSGVDGGMAHVLLNLAVGGSWPGAPTASSLPAKLLVKSIRVWQR